jgi:aryl-alcohol dehydrogenase-like predicted oxidoreductase
LIRDEGTDGMLIATKGGLQLHSIDPKVPRNGRSPVMLPISGTSKLAHLEENVAAADIHATLDREGEAKRLGT